MKRFIFVAPIILAGCLGGGESTSTGAVDFSYAKPNRLGMYDPRATPAGTFYSWNTETNRLTPIGEVSLTAGTSSQPRNVKGDKLAGFGVEGLPIADLKVLEATIGGEFKTEVKNSIRQQFFNSKTALRDYTRAKKADGATTEDILDLFQPKDEKYRTVIFVAEDRSESATFRVGALETEGTTAAKFKIQLPGQEILTVTADAVSSAGCEKPTGSSGDRPVCFTEVIVYDPYIQENGNLDWRVDDSYSQTALSMALRKL
ncbi:hypothetical protein So717_43300 [Roseobacter cerasinus]|uniref:Lipoprotein n=1 Tax=Roseobacter cerasinus TaxID=2602289 RepID=A0A640VXE2_9RHOB|nr:hypothetical protein [Roseobacter cerasinus]GFE52577.1 hypothetical protein So717_43300 [Roseobacter cerasinus]